MKKIKCLCFIVAFFFLIICAGCHSSMEEALYVIQKLPDFQETIQCFTASSDGFINENPFLIEQMPKVVDNNGNYRFRYIAIYKTKNSSFKLVLLSDLRPPNVVVEKEFK
jgi:hypothetical protein